MIKFYGLSDNQIAPLLILIIVFSVLAIVSSTIIIMFYWLKNSPISVLYKMMAASDVVTGVNSVFFVILCFTMLKNCNTWYYHYLFETFNPVRLPPDYNKTGCHRNDKFLLPIVLYLTVVTVRLSLMVNVLMSIARMINIIFPFYNIRRNAMIVCILVWIGFRTVLSTAGILSPFEFVETYDQRWNTHTMRHSYIQRDIFFRILLGMILPFSDPSPLQYEHVLILTLSFGLPLLLLLTSTIMQLIILNTKKLRSSANQQHVRMTVTIIILTIVALACGLPYTIYMALRWTESGNYTIDQTLSFFLGFMFPVLNSALKPLILIVRSQQIKDFIKDRFLCTDGAILNNVITLRQICRGKCSLFGQKIDLFPGSQFSHHYVTAH